MTDSGDDLPPVIVVMGVSGSGKTTLARAVARAMDWSFIEGDDHHSDANRAKMAAGQPLNNDDRKDWIASITTTARAQAPCVISCSALNPTVRSWLAEGLGTPPAYLYLHGAKRILKTRLARRKGHFFDPALLDSQLSAMDPPEDAVRINIALSPKAQLNYALRVCQRL